MFRAVTLIVALATLVTTAPPTLLADETENKGKAEKPAEKPPIELTVSLPKMPATRESLNSGEYVLLVALKNNTNETQLISPYLSLELRDGDGNVVKTSRRQGRFGRRKAGCALGKLKFDAVEPGDVITRKVKIKRYMRDPSYILGWKLTEAGKYSFHFEYSYKAGDLLKRCKEKCASHDDPNAVWNRAWTGCTTVTMELDVK